MPEFIKIATTTDLPAGQSAIVEIEGRTIAVFNVNGQYFALDNTCAHRGGPLGEGFVDQRNLTVQCPWHGWVYSLISGASAFDPTAKVEIFEVKLEGEDVKVSLE
jgi:NAD(P)H-dependent nitrite reductase small subunit